MSLLSGSADTNVATQPIPPPTIIVRGPDFIPVGGVDTITNFYDPFNDDPVDKANVILDSASGKLLLTVFTLNVTVK